MGPPHNVSMLRGLLLASTLFWLSPAAQTTIADQAVTPQDDPVILLREWRSDRISRSGDQMPAQSKAEIRKDQPVDVSARIGGGVVPVVRDCGDVPADRLYELSIREYVAGSLDLALAEFKLYLRCANNTQLSPNAEFYIGVILFARSDYDSALHQFDAVLGKYPENRKTAEAVLMKGRTLIRMGRSIEAVSVLEEAGERSPSIRMRAALELNQLQHYGVASSRPSEGNSTPTRGR